MKLEEPKGESLGEECLFVTLHETGFPHEVQKEEQSASRPRMYFPASDEQANPVLPERQRPQPTALLEPLAQQNEQISLMILVFKPCLLGKLMTVVCC